MPYTPGEIQLLSQYKDSYHGNTNIDKYNANTINDIYDKYITNETNNSKH